MLRNNELKERIFQPSLVFGRYQKGGFEIESECVDLDPAGSRCLPHSKVSNLVVETWEESASTRTSV